MSYVVNSSPGAGLRFEPGATLPDAESALSWAQALQRRGMRLIRIRDNETGQIYDEKSFREELNRMKAGS